MKRYIKHIKKISIIAVSLAIIISCYQNLYAYQIENIVVPKEDYREDVNLRADYPLMVYKKQTAAYYTEETNYENNKEEDNWVYTNLSVENGQVSENTTAHGTRNTFNRIYEYLHKAPNSVYITEATGQPAKGYYATGTLWPTLDPIKNDMISRPIYNITGETSNYKGFYWQPQLSTTSVRTGIMSFNEVENSDDIVILNNNKYRWAVIGGTYISDNYINKETAAEIWEKFGNDDSDKDLTVYNSSVNRTNSSNDKNTDGVSYYQNMDTAFKFWETTVRGKNSSSWNASTSITGNPSSHSMINYYDNTFIIPKGEKKYIYVRHIDVTGKEFNSVHFDASDIDNSMLITGLENNSLIEIKANENYNGKFILTDRILTTQRYSTFDIENTIYSDQKYSEKYELNPGDKSWIVANLKYTNSVDYVKDYNYTTVEAFTGTINTYEQNILDNYNCVGMVRGNADSLEGAIEDRNENIEMNIIAGDEASNAYIAGSSQDKYYVVDFYYEKKPTEVYVRHIDITNKTNISDSHLTENNILIQTNKGRAIITNKYNPSIYEDYKEWKNGNISGNTLSQESAYTYQEYYEKDSDEFIRIANIKYNHETAGKYFENTSDANEYINYTCIGAAVGRGSGIWEAEINRDDIKAECINNSKTKLMYLTGADIIKRDNMEIEKNGDVTSILLYNNDYNVVVVDFYYIRRNLGDESAPDPSRDIKDVYVRHIDVTGVELDEINTTIVNNAIAEGNVLNGNEKAELIGEGQYINSFGSADEYQEWYRIGSLQNLKILKDSDVNYNCVGTNIVASAIGFNEAKRMMNDIRLDYGLVNTPLSSISTDQFSGSGSYAILIDFYYQSKHSGSALDRPTVGRLAFYTLDDTLKTKSEINTRYDNNDSTVYDVVPSGETLKMSIDNAYTYMLGGINIKEQQIEDTYTFNYIIYQKYKVKYYDWSSKCNSCGATDDDYKVGYCGRTIYVPCTHKVYDSETKEYLGTEHENHNYTCNGSWDATSETKYANDTVSRTYTYSIPYHYTFYKVKNMRLYTISKIELYDGYNNSGLPLFDGKTHVIEPKSEYSNSFKDGRRFMGSENTQKASSTKTLEGTLEYSSNNNYGDITEADALSQFRPTVQGYLDNMDSSTAAKALKIEKVNTELGYNVIDADEDDNEYLKATFKVYNDRIFFYDQIKGGRDVYIVGSGSDSTTVENSNYEHTNMKSETYAEKVIDMSKYVLYKKGKTNEEARVYISTVYPKSIRMSSDDAVGSKYLPSSNLTDDRYFKDQDENEDALDIPVERVNGKRYSYGKIYYNLLENNDVLNFDANDTDVVKCSESNKASCHDWNDSRTAVNGAGTNSFVDTEMYNTSGISNPEKTTLILPNMLRQIVWEYGKGNKNDDSKDADVVHVFTPIALSTRIVGQTEAQKKQVDHTTTNTNNTDTQIQKNSRFTIAMSPTSRNSEYSGLNTDKYLMQYYIKFDFDVQDIVIRDAKSGSSSSRNYEVGLVSADNWIGPIYNHWGDFDIDEATISAYALADPNEASNIVNQEKNSYTVRAVAYNTPSGVLYDLVRKKLDSHLVDVEYNKYALNAGQSHNKYYDQKNIEDHINYVAETSVETNNISRVYDFKITDLKDVDWKNIFRKSTSTTTNVHTSKAYYSGVKKWNVYTTLSNDLLTRDTSEIGATKQQILPIGPYKNTNTTYVKAPKLGYKFSFDLKTTGKIDTDANGNLKANKKIVITPSFYYIGKDGTGYNDNVLLFYKNSNNKYVSIDNYKLYFVPDDGYRLTFEGTDAVYRFSGSSLKKSTVSLGKATEITLTKDMMEQADNMFVQIWYGEYKLPNSTIIVAKNNNEYNINNPLTNGYIGVKFDIKVYEYTTSAMTNVSRILSYSEKDKNATSSINTSQWDYEGYLGFSTPGSAANNIKLSLEKGVWNLNNDMYNKIKGTVILYDTDARASSDYD